jgi:hypothetical protein
VVPESETGPLHHQLAKECERAARLLGLNAPIRIDVRRFKDSPESPFALFDVNMKPVSKSDLFISFSPSKTSTEHDRPWAAWP